MATDQTAASLQTLREIRGIMDRSARFLSLSGWSGVWAGCCALAGAGVAWWWLEEARRQYTLPDRLPRRVSIYDVVLGDAPRFLALGAVVFMVALAGAYFFTRRKARRMGQPLWSATSRQLFFGMALTLATGAALCAALLWHSMVWPHAVVFVAPACLLFYGLALVGAGRYTLGEVRYLGYGQIVLGVLNLIFLGYGLPCWALGFGVLHILYGVVMWRRYDRVQAAPAA